jgi:hypothetical protein
MRFSNGNVNFMPGGTIFWVLTEAPKAERHRGAFCVMNTLYNVIRDVATTCWESGICHWLKGVQ